MADLGMKRKEFEKVIGSVFRNLRIQKHLTPEQASQLCGCTLRQWNHYESNGSNSIRILLKIAIALDGSLSPLMDCLTRTFSEKTLESIPLMGSYSPQKRKNINLPAIKSSLTKEERPSVKEKLQALVWLAEGTTVKEVAKRLDKRPGLIQRWLWRYNKDGIGWVVASRHSK